MPSKSLANHGVRNVASSKLKVIDHDMDLNRLSALISGVCTPLLLSWGVEEVQTVRPPHSPLVGSSAHPDTWQHCCSVEALSICKRHCAS